MAVEGTLELFRLPEILQLISQQQKTGILTVEGQQDIVAISFLNGAIVAADALAQTAEEGLERVLVGHGLIAREDFARAAAVHQAAGGRLIDVLLERRVVTRERLLEGLRLQSCELLEQVLSWDRGGFKFYSNNEVSYEEGFKPIPVEELLLRAGEAAAESSRQLAASAPPSPGWPATAAVLRAPAPEPPALPPPATTPPVTPRLTVVRPSLAPAEPERPPTPAPAAAAVPRPEAATAFRRMKVEQPLVVPAERWTGRALALGLALLLVAVILLRPASLVLPFPWQDAQREAFAAEQRRAQLLKIDRAAKTFFQQEGRFPETLAELVQLGLLASADLRDAEGRPLAYAAHEAGYQVQPTAGGTPVPGAEATEAITGNFLLDPEFGAGRPNGDAAPLVLLD